ncbi:MAG TPA: 3-dehydroquinate synthase [Acidobacteriota bacterium]|nr:3-dehydroquinate synthase [Acidobacteriota bacterium]
MMTEVRVELDERSYDICIEEGLLAAAGDALEQAGIRGRRLFLVTNPVVDELHGQSLRAGLEGRFEVTTVLIPDGEEHKTVETCQSIWTRLIEERADRGACLVALGGGVTGDVAGFAAASFLRGVDCVQIPTTLLAQVDSSVGGKTGVNHPLGKNLIGAFHQPRLVLIDPLTLNTLPQREFCSGLYEVVKYGLIRDREFFDFFSRSLDAILNRESRPLEQAIARSCQLKAEICAQDERESDLRRILNLGHTFGHALEAATRYSRLTHGEAVGYGLKAAAVLSRELGRIDSGQCRRILETIDRIGSRPAVDDIAFQDLFSAMHQDKKRISGRLHFIILDQVGKASVASEISKSHLEKSWNEAKEH